MLTKIDSLLNRYTMYKILIGCLSLQLLVAFVFALTKQISIPAGDFVVGLAILFGVGFFANLAFAKAFSVSNNIDAGLISCLILACILQPPTNLTQGIGFALAAVVAMASKYLLVWRRSPIFNPAAIGAFVVGIAHLTLVTWWIGNPSMAIFCAITGAIILRKQRKFSLFAAFALAGLLMFFFVAMVSADGQTGFDAFKTYAFSYPTIFLGTIMLTEPTTLPTGRYYQILYGLLVGSIFSSQLSSGRLSTTPQAALLIGNLFAFALTARYAAKAVLKNQAKLADNIYELSFDKPAGLKFLPGQYLDWTLLHGKTDLRGNRRSFSIASSPNEPDLKIGIKTYQPSSTFKTALLKLQVGRTLQSARPAGEFVLPKNLKQPLLFIAGGIGITPFRSMVKYLVDTNQACDITLLYSAANQQEFVYKDVFDAATAVGVKTHYVVGRLSEEQLVAAVKKVSGGMAYLSGPNGLVQNYRRQLISLGMKSRQIKTDYFSGY